MSANRIIGSGYNSSAPRPIGTLLEHVLLLCSHLLAPPPTQAWQTAPPATPGQTTSSGQDMSPTAILAGRAKIAYPPDVSGAVEVEVAFRNLPKPADWDRNLRAVCEARKQTLALAVGHLQQLLDPDDPDSFAVTRPDEVGRVHFSLAQLLAYQGEMEPAIRHWTEAYKFASTHAPRCCPSWKKFWARPTCTSP